ncbi:hypothetical protein ATO6_01315 [Oceanicola sp. 22II-s10i]|nr:hypothetical protein ATO6_01315 [Oceanicola sp. 22II-s10i]
MTAQTGTGSVRPEPLSRPADGGGLVGTLRARLLSRAGQYRHIVFLAGQIKHTRGMAMFDGMLFLMAICSILLPTSAGFALANAAASTIVGLPFAILMFLSPFALMALLPLRVLYLALDGLLGIRLRLSILAPLALVSLAIFMFIGPLAIRPAAVTAVHVPIAMEQTANS